MAAKQQADASATSRQVSGSHCDVIGRQVLQILGQPDALYSIAVRQLWEDRYRVNVFVGLDAAASKVAHSYFVIADADGNIIASSPVIARTY